MSQAGLESFGAYQKARELFNLVVTDMAELRKDPRCYRLIAQQVASADSVCANIEGGYGRLSRTRSQNRVSYLRQAHLSLRADRTAGVFCRPFGTWGSHFNAFPGLKAWAIFNCPSGTCQNEIHPTSGLARMRDRTRISSPSTLDIRPSPP
jgi:hypothetical protein